MAPPARSTVVREMELSEREQQVYDAIPQGGGAITYFRVPGLTSRQLRATLEKLEQKGVVEREPNGYGPETPWWWIRLPLPPETPTKDAPTSEQVVRGAIYDRVNTDMVWLELTGEINEHGCAVARLKAGENNTRTGWVPLHLLCWPKWGKRSSRGEVTDYSAQFSCPVHGECTDGMVTTKKTCALCGTGLIRW